ncbi:MAG: hypothetical protein M3228_14070 [Actinomycetota bacterium]|nr:hypothetical protein [Actinomycetota bacterium]
MTDDLMRELIQLQQYAAGLQGLLATAQAEAPRSSEGTDRTGTIRASLGPDGLPNSFRIEPGWHRKITAENFGGAVLEAFQAAMGKRLAIWTTTLEQQGWQAQAARLRIDLDQQPSVSGQAEMSPAFGHPVEDVTPRPIDQVAEDMIKAFDHVGDFAAPPPQVARGAGSSRSDKLVLTLSTAGLVSCTADPKWVSAQTAASLMNALGEALTAARADLENSAGRPAPSRSLDRLFTEALALLRDPRRVVDS